jgi:predicted ATPase
MITRIEAKQYRCFRSVNQELGPFHVLVGPNGSGKSTFLDIVTFLGSFVSNGLAAAVEERSANFYDMVWGRQSSCFELAIETQIFQEQTVADARFIKIRYEFAVNLESASDTLIITKEKVILDPDAPGPQTLLARDQAGALWRSEAGGEGLRSLVGANYSALAQLDMTRFPASAALGQFLREQIHAVMLENKILRAPSPPGKGYSQIFDGSNLAPLALLVHAASGERFDRWISHVQTALPDLNGISVYHRPEDNHRYLMLHYKNGTDIPSWIVSDGTLRLLQLSLLPYLPKSTGVYLVEEPENGVHPTALEVIYQSLSSIYGGQVLVTSHSPVLLNLASPKQLLCFQKTTDGSAIIRGDRHPALQDWKREVSMSDLFAAGVLG